MPLNRDGNLTESTNANIVLRFGDTWWTPDVGSGCLPGVSREELLATDQIVARTIARDELFDADEIALVNSVRGWRRAKLVADASR